MGVSIHVRKKRLPKSPSGWSGSTSQDTRHSIGSDDTLYENVGHRLKGKGEKKSEGRDDPDDFYSVTMRPKRLGAELTLIAVHQTLAFVALLTSIAVLSCAFRYKDKYKDNKPGQISLEQRDLNKFAMTAVWLVVGTAIATLVFMIFEGVSVRSVRVHYVQVIDLYMKAYDHPERKRLLEDALLADEVLTEVANRKWLRWRIVLYICLALAVVGVYAWLARMVWTHGTHAPRREWRPRMVTIIKNKGRPNEKVMLKEKKFLEIYHPECTKNRPNFCQELKNMNYFMIASIVAHSLWVLDMLIVFYHLQVASSWPELNTIMTEFPPKTILRSIGKL